jgi:hypothetical protein
MDFYRLLKIWDPGRFQGRDRTRGYFEGWYFKLVSADLTHALAIIPGLSLGEHGEAYCFIQVLDGLAGKSWFLRYPASDFKADDKRFEITIGPNRFNSSGIALSIKEADLRLEGSLAFGKITPWPVNLLSPGAMGWYAFVPEMECYHGVLSFDHGLEGTLNCNGVKIDFRGGRGYIEKDWGTSFPGYHIWCQSNSFNQPGISVIASVANIPWRGGWFDGFLAALLFDGRLYRFTTYSHARVSRLCFERDNLIIHFSNSRYRLEIEALHSRGQALASPASGAMTSHLRESLDARLDVKLMETLQNRERELYAGKGVCSGLEIEATIGQLKEVRH